MNKVEKALSLSTYGIVTTYNGKIYDVIPQRSDAIKNVDLILIKCPGVNQIESGESPKERYSIVINSSLKVIVGIRKGKPIVKNLALLLPNGVAIFQDATSSTRACCSIF